MLLFLPRVFGHIYNPVLHRAGVSEAPTLQEQSQIYRVELQVTLITLDSYRILVMQVQINSSTSTNSARAITSSNLLHLLILRRRSCNMQHR